MQGKFLLLERIFLKAFANNIQIAGLPGPHANIGLHQVHSYIMHRPQLSFINKSAINQQCCLLVANINSEKAQQLTDWSVTCKQQQFAVNYTLQLHCMSYKWDRATFKWNKSYEDCCNELNWVTLERRRDILTCCQVYKIVNNLDCIRFQHYFSFSKTITRSHSLSLVCNHSRINSFRYSFFIRSAFLWNSLPSDLVQSISYNSFKLKLKHYYLLH